MDLPRFTAGTLSQAQAEGLNTFVSQLRKFLPDRFRVDAPLIGREDPTGYSIGFLPEFAEMQVGVIDTYPNSQLNVSDTFTVQGGPVNFVSPIEFCGFQFWCCTTYTIPSSTNNDVDLPTVGKKAVYDLSTSGTNSTITGIIPATFGGGSTAGPQIIVLNNVDATHTITFTNQDASSTATNRMILPPTYGASVALSPGDSLTLWYDTCTSTRWRVLSCTVDIDTSGFPAVNGFRYSSAGSQTLTNGATKTLVWANNIGDADYDPNALMAGDSKTAIINKTGYYHFTAAALLISNGGENAYNATLTIINNKAAGGSFTIASSWLKTTITGSPDDNNVTIECSDDALCTANDSITVTITNDDTTFTYSFAPDHWTFHQFAPP
jgi:hypothetical protein